MLVPVPLFQQFRRKRIAVGPAFGVEACAGITVPVPCAADVAAGFEHPGPEAEFAQLVELIKAANAGTNDDGVVLLNLHRAGRREGFVQGGHLLPLLHVVSKTGACPWPGVTGWWDALLAGSFCHGPARSATVKGFPIHDPPSCYEATKGHT